MTKRLFLILALIFSQVSFIYSSPAANLDAEVTNLVGSGGAGIVDGARNVSKFFNPVDVDVDSSGNPILLDAYSIRRLASDNSVRTIWRQPTNSDWFCAMAVDKNDVIWVVNCGAFNVYQISLSGQILRTISLPARSSWGDGVISGIDFLPSGNLLIPTITSGIVLQVTPSGAVSVFKQFAASGACSGGRQPSGNDVCPFSLAISLNGEVLMTGRTPSGHNLFRLESDRTLTQLFSVRNPYAIRFTDSAFYVQHDGWGGSCTQSFTKVSRLTGDFSSTEIASIQGPAWSTNGFAVLSNRNLIMPIPGGNFIVRQNLSDSSAIKIGNANLGCQNGPAVSSSLFWPSGIVEDSEGNLFIKDDRSIRKLNKAGEVSAVVLHSDWFPMGRLFIRNGSLIFIDNQRWIVSIPLGSSVISRRYLYTVTGDGPQYNSKSMAMDPDGNIYMILNRNEVWTDKFLRKIDTNGNFTDFNNLGLGNSDAGIEIDTKGNIYLGVNGQIRRYSNLTSNTYTVMGSYFGNLLSLRSSVDGAMFILSESFPTILLNRVKDGVVDNIIQGSSQGSSNDGRSSSFWGVDDMFIMRSGEIVLSERTNNTIRKIAVKGIASPRPSPSASVSETPLPTPTPTPFITPIAEPSPSKSSQKPRTPTFNGVNFVGNKINIDVNLGSSAEERPDRVYLVAPKLGIGAAGALAGVITGNSANWSIDFGKLLAGTMIPLEIVSEKDGIRSDPLTGSYQIPAIIDAARARSVPVAPKNFKSRIIGSSAVITVEATTKSGALATNGFLFSKSLGISKAEAIEGDVVGEKVILEVPIKASMAGKRFPVTIYLANQKGESKPLNATLSIPAAPKVPSIPTALPTPKAPKTVICIRANQTRAFTGTSCPPGWEKR